jgi:hypothetical protein
MNNTRRIVLILVSGLVMVCLCLVAAGFVAVRSAGWVLARTLERDAATVAEVGNDIATYELPAGFGDAFAADLAGFSLVGYTGADRHSHIYLFQAPATVNLDQVDMEQQLRRGAGADNWVEVTEVDRYPCEIRGQQTTLVVSEGANHEQEPYRTASALFAGKGGTALVNISMPSASWDQAVVDEFIESLR